MRKMLKLIRSFAYSILAAIAIVGYSIYIWIDVSDNLNISDYLMMGIYYILIFSYMYKCNLNRRTVTNLKNYYKSIVDVIPHAVCECDFNGLITYVNPEYKKIMKCTSDNLVGFHIWDFVVNRDRLKSQFFGAIKDEDLRSYIGRLKLPTGDPIDVVIKLEFRYDSEHNKISVISIFTNVTELYEVKEKLKKSNDELEIQVKERTHELCDLNKELEAFTFAVSHDLQQPLRAITGFTKIINDNYSDNLDDVLVDYINRIHFASKRMETITNELLRLSRITVGDVIRTKCDVTSLINQSVSNLKSINPKHVDITIQEDMFAYADNDMVSSIFDNLLDNSWKYTRDIEKPIIKIGCLSNSCVVDMPNMRHAIYYVDDNGIGFDMKHADKLFKAFYKLKFKKSYEGSGIGLSTVYRIVKKHNGDIWVESREGEGTTIYFTLDKYM